MSFRKESFGKKNILGITTFGKTAIVVPIHLDKLHLGEVPLVEQHFVENL
jgi:hypothetical protein